MIYKANEANGVERKETMKKWNERRHIRKALKKERREK